MGPRELEAERIQLYPHSLNYHHTVMAIAITVIEDTMNDSLKNSLMYFLITENERKS